MGTYLSTPVTEKNQESGESLACPVVPVAWGVVDMQGWRKSMEDAHVAQTDVNVPVQYLHQMKMEISKISQTEEKEKDGKDPVGAVDSKEPKDGQAASQSPPPPVMTDAKVFGVFDGHGGPEVARFCQLYFTSVLTQQPTWTELPDLENTYGDNPAEESQHYQNLMISSDSPCQTPIGKALISTFHALDRMIDDPNRREELVRLRAVKPFPGERHDAVNIPPLLSSANEETKTQQQPALPASPPPPTSPPVVTSSLLKDELEAQSTNSKSPTEGDTAATAGGDTDPSTGTDSSTSMQQNEKETLAGAAILATATNEATDKQEGASTNSDEEQAGEASDETKADDDSDKAVGMEEAALLDQDLLEETENENQAGESLMEQAEASADALAGKVSVMFQRLLNISSSSPHGQFVVQGGASPPSAGSNNQAAPATGTTMTQSPSASIPSLVRNGRLICNLPDHPVHAGATAVVAVIVGKTITVANAGDSRAVLCRNGIAFPLSFDHKPLHERELTRIRNAGGFVNHFGRVNGNLNLSRSIGDLKYKQVPGIAPSDQMITAEPDIVQ